MQTHNIVTTALVAMCSDSQVITAAHKALAFINAGANPAAPSKGLVEIVSGSQQVVAGIRYELVLRVADTQCTAAESARLQNCAVVSGAAPAEVTVSVWVRLWLPEEERYIVKVL
jgi:hypothetical protein